MLTSFDSFDQTKVKTFVHKTSLQYQKAFFIINIILKMITGHYSLNETCRPCDSVAYYCLKMFNVE